MKNYRDKDESENERDARRAAYELVSKCKTLLDLFENEPPQMAKEDGKLFGVTWGSRRYGGLKYAEDGEKHVPYYGGATAKELSMSIKDFLAAARPIYTNRAWFMYRHRCYMDFVDQILSGVDVLDVVVRPRGG